MEVGKGSKDTGSVKLNLTRRGFMKGALSLCSASALAGCSKSDDGYYYPVSSGETPEKVEESIVPVVCRPNCGGGCYQNAHVRNGRIVKISRRALPDKRYERTCLRGLSQMQRIYSPKRIPKPLIRDESTPRGKAIFKSVDWDVAIEHIANKLVEIHNDPRYGKKAVANMPSSANYGVVHKALWNRFFYSVGETVIHPRMDWSLSVGFSKIFGKSVIWPFMTANEATDYVNSKTIILWGNNFAESQAMLWHLLMDAVDNNGAKLITVDVAMSPTAARSHRFVNIKPATDTLMALSMMYVIMFEQPNLVDRNYMAKNTVAQFLVNTDTGKFLKYGDITNTALRNAIATNSGYAPGLYPEADAFIAYDPNLGTYVATYKDENLFDKHKLPVYAAPQDYAFNGVPTPFDGKNVKTAYQLLEEHVADFSPVKTAIQTGVDAQVVRDVAITYATNKPSSILTGFAADHYTNGHHFYHAVATLGALTGNIGKKGASVGWFIVLANMNTNAVQFPPELTGVAQIPYNKLTDVFDNDTITPEGNGGPNELFRGASNPVRALFINYSNPLNTYTDPNSFIERVLTKKNADGSYKMELVVLTDYEMVDVAEYADVILPISHLFEQEDIVPYANHPYTLYTHKAIEPFGETKSDGEIARLLFEKMKEKSPNINSRWPEYDEAAELFFNDSNMGAWQQNITGKSPIPGTFNYQDLKTHGVVRSLPGSISEPYIYPMKRGGTASDPDLVFDTIDDGLSCGSRRIEFYTDTVLVDPGGNYGQATGGTATAPFFKDNELTTEEWKLERLPSWEPTIEEADASIDKTEYPFVLISERPKWRIHSQWYDAPWLREFDPYPTAKINKTDAENMAGGPIVTGDIVRVENKWGHCICRAVVSIGMREGVVNLPKGWHFSQYREFYGDDAGSAQCLTSKEGHKVTMNQNFYGTYVKVTKVSGGI